MSHNLGGGVVGLAGEDKPNSVGFDGAATSKQMIIEGNKDLLSNNANLPMTPNTVAQRLSSEKNPKKKNNFSQAMNMTMTMSNNNANLLNS